MALCSRDEREAAGRRAVCSFSMGGHGARLWTERIRNDGDKGMLGSTEVRKERAATKFQGLGGGGEGPLHRNKR